MTKIDVLATFIKEGDTVFTTLYNELEEEYMTAVVESVVSLDSEDCPSDKICINYVYPNGLKAYQVLQPHSIIFVKETNHVAN